MKSPIAESDRSGDTIKTKALSREPGNPGWTYDPCVNQTLMGDLDNDQFQPNQPHDVADDTVAQMDAEIGANHNNNDMLNMMNNREWTDEQKYRIVEIDTQERKRGKNFMKRIKSRWEVEYPASRRTAQNLVDNARRFRNQGWGGAIDLENENGAAEQAQAAVTAGSERLECTTDMKVLLVMLDEKERAKGRGFMKRVKERWE
jgi:hypothetical protein